MRGRLAGLLTMGALLSGSAGCKTEIAQVEAKGTSQQSRPVLVELFTSEGCSSCPPADALLAKLDQQKRLGDAEIIALEEHVDYWDGLGWRDPFSGKQWTDRQEEYARAFGNEGVYTPQMVVDGRSEFVGSSQGKAQSAIAQAAKEPKAEITISGLRLAGDQVRAEIQVKMLPAQNRAATIWIAVTESGLHSNVKSGENAGEDLHHAAVVRSLRKAGEADVSKEIAYAGQQELQLDPAWEKENLRLVVFVQDPKSQHILGATSLRLAE